MQINSKRNTQISQNLHKIIDIFVSKIRTESRKVALSMQNRIKK